MKLSIIIPAYNEEKLIAGCLQSVRQALAACLPPSWTAEVIVTDNNSTDRTAALARGAGARVVFEPINQISRARNAGAAVAEGDWCLFIDADSRLASDTLRDLIRSMEGGRLAGGGCLIALDQAPLLGRIFVEFWNLLSRSMRWAAGSFVFCRADAFRDIGGFPTDLFAAEELQFSINLKRWARAKYLRLAILTRNRHVSSGRKFELYPRREMLSLMFRTLLRFRSTLTNPAHLALFYDGRR